MVNSHICAVSSIYFYRNSYPCLDTIAHKTLLKINNDWKGHEGETMKQISLWWCLTRFFHFIRSSQVSYVHRRYNPASAVETLRSLCLLTTLYYVKIHFILCFALNKLQVQHLNSAIERILTIVIPFTKDVLLITYWKCTKCFNEYCVSTLKVKVQYLPKQSKRLFSYLLGLGRTGRKSQRRIFSHII